MTDNYIKFKLDTESPVFTIILNTYGESYFTDTEAVFNVNNMTDYLYLKLESIAESKHNIHITGDADMTYRSALASAVKIACYNSPYCITDIDYINIKNDIDFHWKLNEASNEIHKNDW